MRFTHVFVGSTPVDRVVDLTSTGSPIPDCLQYIESHIDNDLREVLRNMRRVHDDRKVLLFPVTIVDVNSGERHEEWQFKGPGWAPGEFEAEKQMASGSGRPFAVYYIAEGVLDTIMAVRPYTVDD